MWKCNQCGCMEIAASLEICPACRTPRGREGLMPKAYHSGSSNGLEEESSAGSSSLTSGSLPDTSGKTSTTGPQSPVPSAESPSEAGPEKTQTHSDASLTDGSTQETTPVRQSPRTSLEAQSATKSGSRRK